MKVEEARFGIRAGIVAEPVTFTVISNDDVLPKLPAGWTSASKVFEYTFSRSDGTAPTLALDLWVELPYVEQGANRIVTVYSFNRINGQWRELPTNVNRADKRVRLTIREPAAKLVVAESDNAYIGIASWYRTKKHPNGAAFNGAPLGSKLLVTNLDNGKSVTVKVVSSGPYVRNRVIDLSHTAFSRLAPRNAGLFRAKVKVIATTALAAKNSSRVGEPPGISSPAAAVYDLPGKSMLWEKAGDDPRPIASLTKLITASVFLDTDTPMDKIVTFSEEDHASCSCLKISPGETLRVKDLFNAMLVGSANNAANALVRSTGLTRKEFVKRMNDKARDWGLSSVSFVEPTGLEAKNLASAKDVAKLAALAFDNDKIASATKQEKYSFKTLNTEVSHMVKNRNLMVKKPFALVGSKTGFIDESGYSLVTEATSRGGNGSVVVVILGSSTDRQRYDETAALLTWAL